MRQKQEAHQLGIHRMRWNVTGLKMECSWCRAVLMVPDVGNKVLVLALAEDI